MSVSLGDVSADDESVVTPAWTAPVAGTQVWVADHSTMTRRVPFWAVVLAVLFFPFGLLFLLLREPTWGGYMQVNVVNGDQSWLTTVPARSAHAAAEVYELAKAIRALA